MPIRVNMFGLRLTSDVQKRWKNGHPPHRTTGVARASSTRDRLIRTPLMSRFTLSLSPSMLPIAIAISGAVNARLTQKRRDMLRSSGFSWVDAVTVRGSRAMPQIGQEPGAGRTIWGCMGQVYSVRADATGTSGSRAIPQEGQAPGLVSRTSGHMGHT